jgi:cytidylate kinase
MNAIVTIDGPAGAGKSTVSRLLAKRLHYLYLDTGAMYRAVALEARRKAIPFEDGFALGRLCRGLDLHFRLKGETPEIYNGEEDISLLIRDPEMDMLSSRVSMVKEVRAAMTELQQRIGKRGRLVAEGRDMGTVVFPDADHKFFITASPAVRAERRYRERLDRGEPVSREAVETDLMKRDDQDSTRTLAPLHPAADAHIVDTSELGAEQVVEALFLKIKEKQDSEGSPLGDKNPGATRGK